MFVVGKKCICAFAVSVGGCTIYMHKLQMWALKENSNLLYVLEFWQALICT